MDYAPGPKPVEHSVASYTAGALGVLYASARYQVSKMVPTTRNRHRASDGNDSRAWAKQDGGSQKEIRAILQKDGKGIIPMKWIKLATQGGGWAAMLTALITLLLKQFGFEVNESVLAPLVVSGLGMIQGGAYIPVPSVAPVMSDLHNKTIDALYHLDGILDGDDVKKAIGVLWNAARSIPQEVKK